MNLFTLRLPFVWAIFSLALSVMAIGQTLPNNPYLWVKSDAGISKNGDVLTNWADQTGNGFDLDQQSGSPKIVTLSSNTTPKEIVRLNGNSAPWISANDFARSDDRSIVFYVRVNQAQDGFLFDGASNNGKTRLRAIDGKWYVNVDSDGNGDQSSDVNVGVWETHVLTFDRQTSFFGLNFQHYEVKHYVNGVLVNTYDDTSDSGQSGLIIGADVGANNKLDIDVAECIFYNRVLTAAEVTDAHGFLSNKWAQPSPVAMLFVEGDTHQEEKTILSGSARYPLMALKISTSGELDPFEVSQFQFDLTGTTDLSKVKAMRIYTDSNSSDFSGTVATHTITSGFEQTHTVILNHTLTGGDNYIWVEVETHGTLPQGTIFDGRILNFTITGDSAGVKLPNTIAPPEKLIVGNGFYSTVIRKQGDEGVHTFRIPGLDTSNAGTVLAVYDIRYNSTGDLPGDVDVGFQRSTDGGVTWSAMQTIMDFDASEAGSQGNGVGDPAILVDRSNGRIWVMATASFGDRSWTGSGPGIAKEDTGQLILVYSDDDGLTWSDHINITAQAKTDPNWHFVLQGPGKGISLRNGMIAFPLTIRELGGLRRSSFIISEDHGATWHTAPWFVGESGENPATTESQIVELDNGKIMISSRNHDGRKKRAWATYTWDRSSHSTMRAALDAGTWAPSIPGGDNNNWVSYLLDDPTCQASFERYRSTKDGYPYSVLMFSNPNNPNSRNKMTVRISIDEGQTWPYSREIDGRPAAYSCLTVLPDGDIGILYETGDSSAYNTITFARFPLTWIVGENDSDNDGMSDFYEDTNGLDKNSDLDADQDLDQDGATNKEEHDASTRANDKDSKLEAEIKLAPNGSDNLVSWKSVPGIVYIVEESESLATGGWSPVEGLNNVQADGVKTERTLPNSTTTKKFYRIRVVSGS